MEGVLSGHDAECLKVPDFLRNLEAFSVHQVRYVVACTKLLFTVYVQTLVFKIPHVPGLVSTIKVGTNPTPHV